MAFYCKCGCKRGHHEHPLKDAYAVGKCTNLIHVGDKSITCPCPRYTPDKQKNKREYIDLYLYKLLVWVFSFVIIALGISKLDSSISNLVLMLVVLFGGFGVYYYKIEKPFLAVANKEKIEK